MFSLQGERESQKTHRHPPHKGWVGGGRGGGREGWREQMPERPSRTGRTPPRHLGADQAPPRPTPSTNLQIPIIRAHYFLNGPVGCRVEGSSSNRPQTADRRTRRTGSWGQHLMWGRDRRWAWLEDVDLWFGFFASVAPQILYPVLTHARELSCNQAA